MEAPNINDRMFAVPNTSSRIIETITTVILPSTIADSELLVPLSIAPSSVLPFLNSYLILSAVIMLASTPIPIDKIIPAIPGKVIVKELNTVKYLEIAATDRPI